jgi:hypothetical protein
MMLNPWLRKMPPARRHHFSGLIWALAAFACLAASDNSVAQTQAGEPKKQEAAEVALPSAETIVILIRSTLLTLNDAMRTGNYTVLRDVASPSFREANTAGRLYQIFSDLSAKHIDLAAVAILGPQLQQAPSIDQNKRLHIIGYFPGNPVQLNFDLIFEPVNGQWRLFSLSAVPAPTASANVSAAPASAPATTVPPAPKGKPPK